MLAFLAGIAAFLLVIVVVPALAAGAWFLFLIGIAFVAGALTYLAIVSPTDPPEDGK